jgi:hypothetical protein
VTRVVGVFVAFSCRACIGNYLFLDTLPYNIRGDLPAELQAGTAYTSNDYASYNLSGGVNFWF